jgi:hypothetical protein
MSTRSQAPTPALTRAALVGLAVGAVGSSLFGPGIFAGFAAVAIAVGAGLTLSSLQTTGRVLPILGAGLAMLYPLAAIEEGESGILSAAAATLMVMAAGFVLRGAGRGVAGNLALFVAVVLHLGLLGSYMVLVAASGNRVLGALVLVVVAFEVVYTVVEDRTRPIARTAGKVRSRQAAPAPDLNLKAAVAGGAACAVAALGARLFMDPALGLFSSLVFGAAVGAAACLGRAAASAVSGELRSGSVRSNFDPAVFASLNALLLAAGAFYYGFRLYLS